MERSVIVYSEDELAEWLSSAVTRGFKADVEESMSQLVSLLASGNTLSGGESGIDAVLNTARVVGRIQGLQYVIDYLVSRENYLKQRAGGTDGSREYDGSGEQIGD